MTYFTINPADGYVIFNSEKFKDFSTRIVVPDNDEGKITLYLGEAAIVTFFIDDNGVLSMDIHEPQVFLKNKEKFIYKFPFQGNA